MKHQFHRLFAISLRMALITLYNHFCGKEIGNPNFIFDNRVENKVVPT